MSREPKILHAGEYNSDPAFCGFVPGEQRGLYRPNEIGDLIVGYRMFLLWWDASDDGLYGQYKLCSKCRQSPDMALHALGVLDED